MVDAPQDVQRHRWAPAFVFPLCFVLPPHAGHFTVFVAALSTILTADLAALICGVKSESDTFFCL